MRYNKNRMNATPRFWTVIIMIFMAAGARLVPHPWNFTPVAAMALFGGAHLTNRRLAFFIPLSALFLSDIFLGFYKNMPFIYGSFALIVAIGLWVRRHRSLVRIGAGALAGSFSFFLITNFSVWLMESIYPQTFSGLLTCYAAAIPFFRHTLAGDLIYTTLLFGSFYLAEKHFPRLAETSTI